MAGGEGAVPAIANLLASHTGGAGGLKARLREVGSLGQDAREASGWPARATREVGVSRAKWTLLCWI